jgi:histidinol-phosphate phosphatase family protein
LHRRIDQAVILAGGTGSRLRSQGVETPKILLNVNAKSLLENHLDELIKNEVKEVILSLGHKAKEVINFFNSIKNEYEKKIEVKIVIDRQCVGTKNALLTIVELLAKEFILLNGDTYHVDYLKHLIEITKLENYKDFDAIFSTRWSDHPEDSDLILQDTQNRIIEFLKKSDSSRIAIQTVALSGMAIIKKNLITTDVLANSELDFISSLMISKNLNDLKILSAVNNRVIKDIGTVERIKKIIELKLEETTKPAIFIDRDGTLINKVDYINKVSQVKLMKDVHRVLDFYQKKGYLVICISNTPQIARGDLTLNELYLINGEIQKQLKEEGSYVDAFYICPHHPHSGYLGEVPEFKVACNCRKPGTGMIETAILQFPILLEKSIMIGDNWRDTMMGKKMSIQTVLITNNEDEITQQKPDLSFKSFSEYIQYIELNT